jgi:ribosomal protein S18 acetylase RimI-like enzyme
MTTGVRLRQLREDDVPAAVELLAVAHPSDVRHRLAEQLAPGAARRAIVAEADGAVVGAAKIAAEPVFPQALAALVAVDGPSRGRGIGTRLADALMSELGTLDGYAMATCTLRDDATGGRRFAERYGFTVSRHSVGWAYPVAGRGGELSEQAAAAAASSGISVRRTSFDDEADVLIECLGRCMEGLPLPFGPVDLQNSAQYVPPSALILLAEIATAAGRPHACGLTIVGPQAGSDAWYTYFSAVAAEYRRRGVGMALKRTLLSVAERGGASGVVTHNDETNQPILNLNRKVGASSALGYWVLIHSDSRRG